MQPKNDRLLFDQKSKNVPKLSVSVSTSEVSNSKPIPVTKPYTYSSSPNLKSLISTIQQHDVPLTKSAPSINTGCSNQVQKSNSELNLNKTMAITNVNNSKKITQNNELKSSVQNNNKSVNQKDQINNLDIQSYNNINQTQPIKNNNSNNSSKSPPTNHNNKSTQAPKYNSTNSFNSHLQTIGNSEILQSKCQTQLPKSDIDNKTMFDTVTNLKAQMNSSNNQTVVLTKTQKDSNIQFQLNESKKDIPQQTNQANQLINPKSMKPNKPPPVPPRNYQLNCDIQIQPTDNNDKNSNSEELCKSSEGSKLDLDSPSITNTNNDTDKRTSPYSSFSSLCSIPSNSSPISSQLENINYNINLPKTQFKRVSSDDIMDNLISFFNLCYNKLLESGRCRIPSFKIASEILKSKIGETYKLYSKINGENSSEFEAILKMTSDKLYGLIPCGFSQFVCINTKNSHEYHQSKENNEKQDKSSKKSIETPLTRDGSFKGSLAYPEVDLLYFFKNKLKLKHEEEISIILAGFLFCGNICVSCLLYPPTIRFLCGHIICIHCSESRTCPVKTCKSIDIYYKKEIDFNPNIGAKILSLDGGGIRGIVECRALQIIQESLFDIEISSLFDLIVGTSTGGLIGILCASTDKPPKQIIDLFVEMARDVFKKSLLNFSLTKYNRENLRKCFSKVVYDTPFKTSYSKTRVAVTAVTSLYNGTECLFSNYYRKESKNKQIYITECKTIDAAEATSAAPTYFPPFKFNGMVFYDGGIMNNNPCLVAINEFKELWPNKKLDCLISIGTGYFENQKESSNSIFKFVSLIENILTEVDSSWTKCKQTYETILNDDNSFRINQKFDWEIGLDAKDESTIKKLKDSFLHERELLNKAINKLLSSLFYISNLEYWVFKSKEYNSILKGEIIFKLDKLPLSLANQLEKNDQHEPKFYLKEKKSDTVFRMINKELKIDGPCKISFEIENPPDTIDIICRLVSKNNIVNDTSISSCPFRIQEKF